jgi:hypothetical protein
MILAKKSTITSRLTQKSLNVNVWVEKNAYIDNSLNNLNTSSSISGLEALQADRNVVIDEIGNTMADWILPTSELVFGELNEVSGSPSPGLNIFVYDIDDGFNGSGGFVGGYFDPDDKDLATGNRMNALHMDIYPSVVGGYDRGGFGLRRTDFYHVMAHELQHIIHHQSDPYENAWFNEGFSQFAIYRMFHNKDFFNGDRYMVALESPRDAAAQVKFWLANPRTARLMDSDSNSYGTELRGIVYLFFGYLWEQIGGNFDLENPGDPTFRQMIASTETGANSLIAGLGSEAEANEIFDNFPAALVLNSGHEKLRTYFFQEHYVNVEQDFRLKFNSCPYPGCSIPSAVNSGMNSINYPLQAYDFWFIHLYGNSTTPAVLELSSTASFNSFSIPIIDGVRTLKEYNSGTSHLVHIPADGQQILILTNPSSSSRNITLSFERYLSGQTDLVMNYRSTIAENDLYSSTPLEISSAAITGQSFLHQNTEAIDLLNDMPEKIVISARQLSDSCMDYSTPELRFPSSEYLPKTAFNISGTDYYPTGLQLEPDVAYKLCFVNKTGESVSFSPRVTTNKIITDPNEARQSFKGNPPNVTGFRMWLENTDTLRTNWSIDDDDRKIHKIVLSYRKLAPQVGTLQNIELNRSETSFSLSVTAGELWEFSVSTKSYRNVKSINEITKSIWVKAESTVNSSGEVAVPNDWEIADKKIEALQMVVQNGEEIRFFKYLPADIDSLTNTGSTMFSSSTTLSNGAVFFPETLFNFNFGNTTTAQVQYRVQQKTQNAVVYHFDGTTWNALGTQYVKDLKATITPDNTDSNYSIITIDSRNGAGSPFALGSTAPVIPSINSGTTTPTSTPASGNGGGCSVGQQNNSKGWTNLLIMIAPLLWLLIIKSKNS